MVSIASFPVGLALLQLAGFQIRVKRADEIVNNSTVLQDDNDLTFPGAASTTYAFILFLMFSSSTVADFQTAISVPAGADGNRGDWAELTAAGADATWQERALEANPVGAAGSARQPYISIGVVRMGATAGPVTLQWAQNTAEVSNTSVITGSWLIALRLT